VLEIQLNSQQGRKDAHAVGVAAAIVTVPSWPWRKMGSWEADHRAGELNLSQSQWSSGSFDSGFAGVPEHFRC